MGQEFYKCLATGSVTAGPKTGDEETLIAVFQHNGIKWHESHEMEIREFLKTVVKVDNVGHVKGVKLWDQLE
jgi:hypothetical protein